MSLANWLGVQSPAKPIQSPTAKQNLKRKTDDENDKNEKPKKFCKVMSQDNFEWYIQDQKGLWHCEICRSARKGNAYALGHSMPAKTTNQC